MDTHRRAFVRQLFAIATELIEDAHEAALVGQSPHLTARACLKSLQQLQAASRDLAIFAEATAFIAGRPAE